MAIEKVLLVDDDDEMLELTNLELLRQGLQVTCARDGKDALDKLAQANPDIILLDISMPNMNGLEVCRYLKANPATKNIPVIFVTCRGLDEDILKIHREDADGYFIKPFDIAEMAEQVATWGQTS